MRNQDTTSLLATPADRLSDGNDQLEVMLSDS